ncbi:N-acetylmuramic acid 6-phosphate etherase [Janibacter melonis]|uniref:N-acetylmuramic acid 6-phosphate etherase n=1 Tax=Janibacter melonis TaxID=262209 RepID=UPI0008350B06|nr:N-acetylmuramic acid 6-phosphate etherase [Janibacter melonis]
MHSDVTVISPTEGRNPATVGLDTMSTLALLEALNAQDAMVAPAVAQTLPELSVLVDSAVAAIRAGGRVHYVGAGTSGRLGVLDAAELRPTFNAPDGMVVAHHAGGPSALLRAVENVEDDVEQGAADLAGATGHDVVIGLTASGRTPYVAGALRRAREVGAVTALVTSNPQAELAPFVDHVVAPDTGPEALSGSTRLKAGTALKLVLNAFSTAVMVRLGRTWSNLMVDVVATNAKLRGRLVVILVESTGASPEQARERLAQADGELKPALLSLLADVDLPTARDALHEAQGVLADALRRLDPSATGPAAGPTTTSGTAATGTTDSITRNGDTP